MINDENNIIHTLIPKYVNDTQNSLKLCFA